MATPIVSDALWSLVVPLLPLHASRRHALRDVALVGLVLVLLAALLSAPDCEYVYVL